jgi:hypothetical protein
VQSGSRDTLVQKIENGESERFFLFLGFAPGALGGDQVGEERVQAGGGTGRGETVGLDVLPVCSLEPEGCGLDVASNGASRRIFGALEAVALFDGPGESADELDSFGTVG